MEKKNKILLVEPDPKLSFEISIALKNSGYELTDTVPYIFNAIQSIDTHKPDVIMIDDIITNQVVEFISAYVKLPVIIISSQFEKEIYKYSDKLRILTIIQKPYNINEIRVPVTIAFNKLN
jgi:DNA-binding response OmpR family regulator